MVKIKRKEQLASLKEFKKILNDIKNSYEMPSGFLNYGKIYSFTNEESKRMIPSPVENNTALMILSSGDQVFDAILKGYETIDTIDINEFCKYYALGIKKKAIEILTYTEFCQLFDSTNVDNEELLIKVINSLEDEYKEFWDIFYTYLKHNPNFSYSPLEITQMYFVDDTYKKAKNNTSYLKNEESYNELKEKLKEAKITFKRQDVSKSNIFYKKYDMVHFSNVLGYIDDIKAMRIIESIYNNNLSKDGSVIIVGYWNMIRHPYDLKNVQFEEHNDDFDWGYLRLYKKCDR